MITINRLIFISIIFITVGFGMAYAGTLGSSDPEIYLVVIGSIIFLLGVLGMSFVIVLPLRRALRRFIEVLDKEAREK